MPDVVGTASAQVSAEALLSILHPLGARQRVAPTVHRGPSTVPDAFEANPPHATKRNKYDAGLSESMITIVEWQVGLHSTSHAAAMDSSATSSDVTSWD